jgi:hypothetical protein
MSLESLDRAIKKTIDLSVGDILVKYRTADAIALAMQKGEIDPTKAVMAGMAIDSIAKSAMKPSTTTVAQDVFAQPQPQMQGGLGAIAPQGMNQGQPQTAPQMAPQPAGQGLDQIPVPEQMFSEPQSMAGGGIVAFYNGGRGVDKRITDSLSLSELQEYNRSGKLPRRFEIMADPSTAGMVTDPIFGASTAMPTFSGMLSQQGELMSAVEPENIIARAQLGEGPNVHRPAAPADAAVVPPGGPVIPRPTGLETKAAPTPVVKRPQTAAKPLSIFDEAKNAADKLKAYKTQFGITDADPDEAMRKKLKELQEGTKEERRDAAYMAITMAGLGIAGGTSPYFATNLKEAIPALKEYGVAKRDIKKAEMEYTKMESELNRSAEARKRGDMELALRLQESAQDREIKLRTVVAAERNANKPSQLGELIDLATGGDKTKAAEYAQAYFKNKSGPKPMSPYERARLQQIGMKNISEDLAKSSEYRRLSRSDKPEDKAAAERIYQTIYNRHMGAISGASNLGGATLLSYGDE